MSSIGAVLAALFIAGLSGLPAYAFPRRSRAGQVSTTLLLVAGCAFGLAVLVPVLAGGPALALDLPWYLPWGSFSVAVDRLGAVFLALVFVLPPLASIFGLGYWRQDEHEENGRRLGLSFGLLVAAMGLVVLARDGILFLIAWEVMALAAWLASTAEYHKPEVRRAGWVYLVATHVGTLCLFAMFALWRKESGGFGLSALGPGHPSTASVTAILLLALVGFGFKAGLMPLHVWLPGAHANAPSQVSAVMSGVMIKMGVYGILRMSSLLPPPGDWWGWTLLALGGIGALGGIAYALGQRELKRVLAYSSVENIGIITMGIGLASLGREQGRLDLVLLGLGGALLHVWNHGLFKSLLFLDAGVVLHATGTGRIDRLGGLGKALPRAAALFALGAMAISALPPLNGFVGEWLIYLGFFRGIGAGGTPAPGLAAAAMGAVVLAAAGALALAAFVRVFGGVFLGAPRGKPVAGLHDAGGAMFLPMLALALGCVILGLAPSLVLPPLWAAALEWFGLPPGAATLGAFLDLSWLGTLGLILVALAALIGLPLFLRGRRSAGRGADGPRPSRGEGGAGEPGTRPTWDCGYAAPTARMQYTPSSFAEFPLRGLSFLLRPSLRRPSIKGAFPAPSSFAWRAADLVLDRTIRPLARLGRRLAPGIRVIQQGSIQLYLVYIVATTIILLLVTVGQP